MRWPLLPVLFAALLLAACAANGGRETPSAGASKPNYPSIYYFLAGSLAQQDGNYDLADQLYRKALNSDPTSLSLKKRVLLNSFYLYGSGMLTANQMRDLISDYRKLLDFDEELLSASYGFYEQVADSTGMELSIRELETRFPSAQTYIQCFIHSYKHQPVPQPRYLDQAYELAFNQPRQLLALARFYYFFDPAKSTVAVHRALELSPTAEAHGLMAELLVNGNDPAQAQTYIASLSYPADRQRLVDFMKMAFDARALDLILALDDELLATKDLDLLFLLGFSAMLKNRSDILLSIENTTPNSTGLEEDKQSLYSMLAANALLSESGASAGRFIPKLDSTEYYDNVFSFYNFAKAAQTPDSLASSDLDTGGNFVSALKKSLPDSAPAQYLIALATAVSDSTYQDFPLAKFNLVQYLMAHGMVSEDDLQFLLRFYHDQGQSQQRRALLPEAVERFPDNALFLNDLGYTLLLEGEFLEQGASLIRRALQLEPENPFYLDSMAWYYYLIGDYATAAGYLDLPKTMENMPSEIAWHIGAIYLRLNDRDQAREYLRLCVQINDDPEYVNLAQDALRLLGE